jgi:DNA-binding MarR family transcriptional regulator
MSPLAPTHRPPLAVLDALGRALPVDLNGRHIAMLALLAGRQDPPRLHEVASCLGVARSIVTRAVDCFEKHGFAERVEEPTDLRQVRIRITKRGRHFIDTLAGLVAG